MIWLLNGSPLQLVQKCAVPLGIQGENLSTSYVADVSAWLEQWPMGVIALVLQAPDRSEAYIGQTSLDRENGLVTWTITAADTAVVGYGCGELRLTDGEVVKKSCKFPTYTAPGIVTETAEPPEPVPDWITEIIEAASSAVASAEAAATSAEEAAASAEKADEIVEEYDYIAKHIGIKKASTSSDGTITLTGVESVDDLDELTVSIPLTINDDGSIGKRTNIDTSALTIGYVYGKSQSGADIWGYLYSALPRNFVWNEYKSDPETGSIDVITGSWFTDIKVDLLNKTIVGTWGYWGNWQGQFDLTGEWRCKEAEYAPGTLPPYGSAIAFELKNPVTKPLAFDELPFHLLNDGTVKYGMVRQSPATVYTDWVWDATYAVDEYKQELDKIGAVLFDESQSLTDAEKAQARTNIGAADAETVGELKRAVNLIDETLMDTAQTITFDASGNVQRITHSHNNVTVRTDVFTFGTDTITEVRTWVATGETLTIVTNTTTLETTVTYGAAA